jgi:hypothetical protein
VLLRVSNLKTPKNIIFIFQWTLSFFFF